MAAPKSLRLIIKRLILRRDLLTIFLYCLVLPQPCRDFLQSKPIFPVLTAYLSSQSAPDVWVGLSEKKDVTRISGYFRWDTGHPTQPTRTAKRCVYVATNSFWRLDWCHEFKDYVCQTSSIGYLRVAPITASPNISIQKASKGPNVLKFGEKVQVSCTAFHTDGASLYFTFTAPGVTETKRPGDKNVQLFLHGSYAYDSSSGLCWLRSSAVWEVSAGEKHQGGYFSCCRQHPPGCANSATKFVDLSYEEPKVNLYPEPLDANVEATVRCTLYYRAGKSMIWVIHWFSDELILNITSNGSLFELLGTKPTRWRLLHRGHPITTSRKFSIKNLQALKHACANRPI
ncbi:hypothetical protein PoB_006405800 [Plakobranchus ocellatus]|uniref:C-type lectin domain-containing protein n=1 Tax=Plakobranchus ocellatus TaxID=259542 RepID=A0AAV4D0I3_9GAST|nr:hypothetical protein PoB_006405800 [Plakobranchus ocellatus]